MRAALDAAEVVVALCSAAYFEKERFTSAEWEAVFAVRGGGGPRLVPLRVEQVIPPVLLRPLVWADLFDRDVEHARATLLEAVRGRRRPDGRRACPGPAWMPAPHCRGSPAR